MLIGETRDNINRKYANKYSIIKIYNGKRIVLNGFKSYNQAYITKKDLENCNWNMKEIKKVKYRLEVLKYINRTSYNTWRISRTTNTTKTYYGCYKKLTDAITHRNRLIKNNWKCTPLHPFKPSYIHKTKNGQYCLQKQLNNKTIYITLFKDKEDAIKVRDKLIKSNWDQQLVNELRHKYAKKNMNKGEDRYIFINQGGTYTITKVNPVTGKQEGYGTYNTLEDARCERDLLERHNWDFEEVVDLY